MEFRRVLFRSQVPVVVRAPVVQRKVQRVAPRIGARTGGCTPQPYPHRLQSRVVAGLLHQLVAQRHLLDGAVRRVEDGRTGVRVVGRGRSHRAFDRADAAGAVRCESDLPARWVRFARQRAPRIVAVGERIRRAAGGLGTAGHAAQTVVGRVAGGRSRIAGPGEPAHAVGNAACRALPAGEHPSIVTVVHREAGNTETSNTETSRPSPVFLASEYEYDLPATGYPLDSPDPNLLCRPLFGFCAAD